MAGRLAPAATLYFQRYRIPRPAHAAAPRTTAPAPPREAWRRAARRLLLAARPGRPRGARLPRGGKHLAAGIAGARLGPGGNAVRGNQGADPADRHVGAVPRGGVSLSPPLRGRPGVPHPLPPAVRRRRAAARGGGNSRRQRGGGRPRVLRCRLTPGEPGRVAAGLCGRHGRAPQVHGPLQRSAHRPGPAGCHPGRDRQRRLGGRQRRGVLCAPGSGNAPPVPDPAASARRRPARRPGRVRGIRPGVLLRRLAQPVAALHPDRVVPDAYDGDSLPRRRRPPRRSPSHSCRASGATSTRSIITAGGSTCAPMPAPAISG